MSRHPLLRGMFLLTLHDCGDFYTLLFAHVRCVTQGVRRQILYHGKRRVQKAANLLKHLASL